MANTVVLPDGYGYVILTFVASIFVLLWKGFKVGSARKKFNVQYPTMYSTTNDQFNCVQRAHQNTLESYPYFLVLLFLAGLEMPCLSALAGVVYLAGRVVYALGYYTGDPKNRSRGAFSYFGLLTLLGLTIKLGLGNL